jgi:hypothetical protein
VEEAVGGERGALGVGRGWRWRWYRGRGRELSGVRGDKKRTLGKKVKKKKRKKKRRALRVFHPLVHLT